MSRIVLGILAGMGPRTSAPFLDAVLEECRRQYGAARDEDFPDIALYSLPAPFRPDEPLDRAAMEAALRRGMTALTRAGAQLIAVACNTAHLYFEAIAAATSARVLHIVDETLTRLPHDAKPAAVLATRATAASRLYHDALAGQGRRVIEPPGLQDRVDALIARFKADGAAAAGGLWRELRGELEASGVGQVVLACTDLAFCAAADLRGGLRVVDSSAALADALVAEFCRLEGLVPRGAPGS